MRLLRYRIQSWPLLALSFDLQKRLAQPDTFYMELNIAFLQYVFLLNIVIAQSSATSQGLTGSCVRYSKTIDVHVPGIA